MSEELQKEGKQEPVLQGETLTELQMSQDAEYPVESGGDLSSPIPEQVASDASEETLTQDNPPEEQIAEEERTAQEEQPQTVQAEGDGVTEPAKEAQPEVEAENAPVQEETPSDVSVEPAETSEEAPVDKKRMVLVTALLVLAIVMCVGVVSQVLSKGYVSIGGFSLFRVVTGSMEPEIPVGSLLISRKTDIGEIQVGDIVNYRSQTPGMLGVVITHRVIAIHEDSTGQLHLETKGDANQYADGTYVKEENLIGRVTYYTKEGNLFAGVFTFLTSSVGFLACIVLPCLVIGLMTIQDCIRSMQSELDRINHQLKQAEEESSQELDLSAEEYQELYNKLRNELLEELKQGAEKQTE